MMIDIITIFPGMFGPIVQESILKRAQEKKKASIRVHDLRAFATDRHRSVDDRPFGGGPGMVMMPEPLFKAVRALRGKSKKARVVLMCPQGEVFTQACAKRLARQKHLIIICGHYEGVDERVRECLADEEISIGDFVLTGGELPAMVVVDALVRLIPGVLGDKNSLNCESFEGNLLEHPQYTRPAQYEGHKVPAVLLSGDHAKIARWRIQQAVARTGSRRPDLLRTYKQSHT
jgi:tRNA (guanine37-N1)-methyltransferase